MSTLTHESIVNSVFGKGYTYVRGYQPKSAGIDPASGMLGHSGWDVSAPKGTPVYALASGTVGSAGWQDAGGGNVVAIDVGDTEGRYAHLADIAVSKGQIVHAGDLIGHVGQTGITTGPHLHFSLYRDGKAVDPSDYLAQLSTGQPARASNAAAARAGTTPSVEASAAAYAAAVRRDPSHAIFAYGLVAAGLLLLGLILLTGGRD